MGKDPNRKVSKWFRLPGWVVRAVQYEAIRRDESVSETAASILAAGVSAESRRHAETVTPEPVEVV